jgi:hypothetical protein
VCPTEINPFMSHSSHNAARTSKVAGLANRPQRRAVDVLTAAASLLCLLAPVADASAQLAARMYPLASLDGLQPHNVTLAVVTHAGKRGVRVAIADSVQRVLATLPLNTQTQVETFAVLTGTDFGNGVIDAEIAGAPGPGATAGARGFVGIAFRLQADLKSYDALYLRPTNGRATDQERRNHAAQYIAHPDWPWDRLRRETPSRYEAYVDLVPDAWTRVRIEVRGDTARLFVHGQQQPTLIVSDVKSGATTRGAVALWINPGTVAHFRNVRITPRP